MSNHHQQARMQFYLDAYKLTHNEMTKFTKTTNESTKTASAQAKIALELFDKEFPDPNIDKQNQSIEFMEEAFSILGCENSKLAMNIINSLLQDNNLLNNQLMLLGDIDKKDVIFEITKLIQRSILLEKIELDYDILQTPVSLGDIKISVNPRYITPSSLIIPERDTQHHPVPPEYLENDPLDCINNKCDPSCNTCGRLDGQKLPDDYTGWIKDGTASNKILAYARNGKICYGITILGNWINTPAGTAPDKTHIIAPIEEVNVSLV